ncbi:MAG TPA: nuclear transport factor 2 family protein [Gemmatimonadaceae bacterium]
MRDPSAAPTAHWQDELLALEEQTRIAFLNGDIPTLERLWSEDFVVNSPMQVIRDNAQVIEQLRSGRIRHTAYTVDIERVVRFGDVAIVMGRDLVDGPPDGKVVRRRFTNVWQLQDGAWRTIARHAHVSPGDVTN